MNNDELYHYGVPGMRWGKRKTRSTLKTGTTKTKKEAAKNKQKPKLSVGKKVAIGSAVTGVALAGIGTMLAKDAIRDRYLLMQYGKALADNLW